MNSKLYLYIFYLCITISNTALPGGWKKGSFRENDLGIDGAFKKAFEIYSKDNPNANIDYTQRLTIYRQTVNGINYRMCFIDLKSTLNVVQEYIISGPPFNQQSREPNFNFFEKNTFKAKTEMIQSTDKRYPRIQNTLFGFLKNSGENILFINTIQIVETTFDNFFIVNAQGEKKTHYYVVGQSKENEDDYEGYGILQ